MSLILEYRLNRVRPLTASQCHTLQRMEYQPERYMQFVGFIKLLSPDVVSQEEYEADRLYEDIRSNPASTVADAIRNWQDHYLLEYTTIGQVIEYDYYEHVPPGGTIMHLQFIAPGWRNGEPEEIVKIEHLAFELKIMRYRQKPGAKLLNRHDFVPQVDCKVFDTRYWVRVK